MPARVTVTAHGPLRLQGDFTIVDPLGDPIPLSRPDRPDRAALCRCGQSERKPFCDASHGRCRFRHEAKAEIRPTLSPHSMPSDPGGDGRAARRQDGRCCIVVNANGAYRIEGDFQLVDEFGEAWDLCGRQSVALCRCGASGDKPFCDGTHNTVRFRG